MIIASKKKENHEDKHGNDNSRQQQMLPSCYSMNILKVLLFTSISIYPIISVVRRILVRTIKNQEK